MPGGKQQILSIIKKEDILNIHCLFEEFGHHSSETLVDCELCAIDKNLLENLLKRKPKIGIILLDFMKKKLVRSYQIIMERGHKMLVPKYHPSSSISLQTSLMDSDMISSCP